MFELSDVYDKTIISIENHDGEKIIHLMGYGYCADDSSNHPYRFVEYTFFYVPMSRLNNKSIEDIENEESELYKQYIEDCTKERIFYIYRHYNNGIAPIILKKEELNESTPYGMYILI